MSGKHRFVVLLFLTGDSHVLGGTDDSHVLGGRIVCCLYLMEQSKLLLTGSSVCHERNRTNRNIYRLTITRTGLLGELKQTKHMLTANTTYWYSSLKRMKNSAFLYSSLKRIDQIFHESKIVVLALLAMPSRAKTYLLSDTVSSLTSI